MLKRGKLTVKTLQPKVRELQSLASAWRLLTYTTELQKACTALNQKGSRKG